ncbi:hypothetical protein BC829DRAFT_469882 [Chytridium lagenaria]|nr:hypothetical protein BC829DRAFT_469882 [Chytridium lagenaria]
MRVPKSSGLYTSSSERRLRGQPQVLDGQIEVIATPSYQHLNLLTEEYGEVQRPNLHERNQIPPFPPQQIPSLSSSYVNVIRPPAPNYPFSIQPGVIGASRVENNGPCACDDCIPTAVTKASYVAVLPTPITSQVSTPTATPLRAHAVPHIPPASAVSDPSWIASLLKSVDQPTSQGEHESMPPMDDEDMISFGYRMLQNPIMNPGGMRPSFSLPGIASILSSATTVSKSQIPSQPAVDNIDPLPPVHLSKSSISVLCKCRDCARTIGILIFYGSNRELSDPVAIDVSCPACAAAKRGVDVFLGGPGTAGIQDSSGATASVSKKRRVKGVGKDMVIFCEGCNRRIGFGGVRSAVDGAAVNENREWEEPRASVEPICEGCVRNFDFCTQCGGGGTYRTGKWRPRQLFNGKRKTCSLSHERHGVITNFQVTTYRCPVEPIEDEKGNLINLTLIQARYGGLQPLGIENSPPPSPTNAKNLRRYMAVVDVFKPKKNLPRDPAIPSLPGQSDSDASDDSISDTPSKPKSPTYVIGYFFVQWNITNRHVNLLHVRYDGRDSVDDSPTRSPLLMMMAALTLRNLKDALTEGHPEPLHLWCLGYKSSTEAEVKTRFITQIEKFGFRPIDEYAKRFGHDEKELEMMLLEDATLPIDFRKELTVYVCRWADVKAAAQGQVAAAIMAAAGAT